MRAEIRERGRQALDRRLTSLKPVDQYRSPPKGWIRAVRDALGMTSLQMGKRLGIRSQSVEDLEKSEANGSVKLSTLRRAAEALDCTLIYALVPNTSLDNAVHSRARKIAMRELSRVAHTMKLEAQGTRDANFEERIENYVREKVKAREIWDES